MYEDQALARLTRAAIRSRRDHVVEVADFGDTAVYRLRDPEARKRSDSVELREIPKSTFEVSASVENERLGMNRTGFIGGPIP